MRTGGLFQKIFGEKRQVFAAGWKDDPSISDDSRAWVKAGRRKIDRSLSNAKQDLVCNRAYKLWSENPFAHRIIQIGVNFIIGEGLTVTAKNDKSGRVQGVLDEFRERNQLDRRDPEIVRDLLLLGEMFVLVPTNDITGDVTCGYIDPTEVKKIEVNPRNYNEALFVVMSTDAAAEPVKFRIIFKEGESKRLTGEIFFWAINKPISATRGLSDIYSVLDWCEGTEDLLWTVLDKAELQTRFVMEIVHEGANLQDLEAIREKEKSKGPPKSGSVFHTNKKGSVGFITPQLGAGELDTLIDRFEGIIYAGSGIPEHWFGKGGDVNRASALEMGTPTHRWLQGRQTEYLDYMRELHQFAIDQKLIYTEELSSLSDEELEFDISAPEIASKDESQRATTLKLKMESIIAAKMDKDISPEQAMKMTAEAFRDAGLELEEVDAETLAEVGKPGERPFEEEFADIP